MNKRRSKTSQTPQGDVSDEASTNQGFKQSGSPDLTEGATETADSSTTPPFGEGAPSPNRGEDSPLHFDGQVRRDQAFYSTVPPDAFDCIIQMTDKAIEIINNLESVPDPTELDEALISLLTSGYARIGNSALLLPGEYSACWHFLAMAYKSPTFRALPRMQTLMDELTNILVQFEERTSVTASLPTARGFQFHLTK